jgi:hypothetical protein
MNRRILLSGGVTAGGLLLLLGCSTSTQLKTLWSDPAAQPGSLHKLMVINVTKSPTVRRTFEDRFAAALGAQGIDAVPSYRLVGDADLDAAQANMEIHKAHCDGVFVTRVVDQKTVKRYYSPAAYRYVPPAVYRDGWYSYYSLGYAYATAPGYVESQLVSMETNLYRVQDGALVWSALSRSWLQQSATPGDEIEPVVHELVRGLSSAAIIARSTDKQAEGR